MNEFPQHFSVIGTKEVTAWNMLDGNVMTGNLVRCCITQDAYTVQRPDGTCCHVPSKMCRPATFDDIEQSIQFFANIGK